MKMVDTAKILKRRKIDIKNVFQQNVIEKGDEIVTLHTKIVYSQFV